MPEHPNVTLLREGFAAFANQDMDVIARIYADDVVVHIPGRSVLAGDYHGIDEIFAFYYKLFALTDGNYRFEPYAFLANDDYAVALVIEHSQRKGKTLRIRSAQTFRVVDGKITEAWALGDDLYAFDDFWT